MKPHPTLAAGAAVSADPLRHPPVREWTATDQAGDFGGQGGWSPPAQRSGGKGRTRRAAVGWYPPYAFRRGETSAEDRFGPKS